MKKLIITTVLMCSFPGYLSAMEQRWQKDFSPAERAKGLPKFPFSDVIEQSTALPGLAFEESVKQTARHLIQYANTAHADQDKANLLTGYLKLAHDKTNAILTRSTYKNSDNPMESLFQELTMFHQDICSYVRVDQRVKSHASIWLALFIIKMEERRDVHPEQQRNYLRAYTLLVEAHKRNATDVCLLLMAKLFTDHNLRVQMNQLGDLVPITDETARDLANQALDRIGERLQPQPQTVIQRIQRQLPVPQPQEIVLPPEAPKVALEFKAVHVPFMNTAQQRSLYRELRQALSQLPVVPLDAMEGDAIEGDDSIDSRKSHKKFSLTDYARNIEASIRRFNVVGKDVSDKEWEMLAQRLSQEVQRNVSSLRKAIGVIRKEKIIPEGYDAVYVNLGKALARLESDDYAVSDDYSKQIETSILRLNVIGKELSKKEWEMHAQTLSTDVRRSYTALRKAIAQTIKRDAFPKEYKEVYVNLNKALIRLYDRQRKELPLTLKQKGLLQYVGALHIPESPADDDWKELARALLIRTNLNIYGLAGALTVLGNNINVKAEQRERCLELSKACKRIAHAAKTSTVSTKKRKRAKLISLELEEKQEESKDDGSVRKTKRQRTE